MQGSEVFKDVVEEFWKLALIKVRFHEWKFGFPESYKQAYVHLFLPNLLAPFVRVQLLQWNPLQVRSGVVTFGFQKYSVHILLVTCTHPHTHTFTHPHTHTHTRIHLMYAHTYMQFTLMQADCCDFEEMSWFEVLMFYGYREGEEPDSSDEDLQLIPQLVDKVLVPRLTGERVTSHTAPALL